MLLGMTRLDAFRHRPMRQLSGGMKQKLGLVCLDPRARSGDPRQAHHRRRSRRGGIFWAILGRLLEEKGVTALVSPPISTEADRFHRVSLFHEWAR